MKNFETQTLWTWPRTDFSDVFFVFLTLVAFYVLVRILIRIVKKKEHESQVLLELKRLPKLKDLSVLEWKILQEFLFEKKIETKNEFFQNLQIRRQFEIYLSDQTQISIEHKLKLLFRIFPEFLHKNPILEIGDVQEGEILSLAFPEKKCLGVVIRKDQSSNLLIKVLTKDVDAPKQLKHMSISRPGSGVFELSVQVNKQRKRMFSVKVVSIKKTSDLEPIYETKMAERVWDRNIYPLEIQNILSKLIQFARLDSKSSGYITSQFQKWKLMTSSEESVSTSRDLRKTLNDSFFFLYENVWTQFQETPTDDPVVLNFLYRGIVEESLVSPRNMEKFFPFQKEKSSHQIFYFSEILKDYKDTRKVNTRTAIQNLFRMNQKLYIGNKNFPIAFLTESGLEPKDSQLFLQPSNLEEGFRKALELDPTVFQYKNENTHLVSHLNYRSILLPSSANAATCLEVHAEGGELFADFLFPTITHETILKLWLVAFAKYRYKVGTSAEFLPLAHSKTNLIKLYSEYLDTFRQNRHLSKLEKSKIFSALSKFKSDKKEMFIADYLQWVQFESKGEHRLNSVVRELFYSFIPFTASVRNSLSHFPNYKNLESKFLEQIRRRTDIQIS